MRRVARCLFEPDISDDERNGVSWLGNWRTEFRTRDFGC